MIESGDIIMDFVNSNDPLADIFTKSSLGPKNKLYMKQGECWYLN